MSHHTRVGGGGRWRNDIKYYIGGRGGGQSYKWLFEWPLSEFQCIFITFVCNSIATLISGDCRPSTFLKADDEVVNLLFADENQEDVDALQHVDDVSHIPEVN